MKLVTEFHTYAFSGFGLERIEENPSKKILSSYFSRFNVSTIISTNTYTLMVHIKLLLFSGLPRVNETSFDDYQQATEMNKDPYTCN